MYYGPRRQSYIPNLSVSCKYYQKKVDCSECGKKTKYAFGNTGICKSCMKKAGYNEKQLTKKSIQTKKKFDRDEREARWARENKERLENYPHIEKLDKLIFEAKRTHEVFAQKFLASIKKCIERGWELSSRQKSLLEQYMGEGLASRWDENKMTRPERVALEKLIKIRSGDDKWWYSRHTYYQSTAAILELINRFEDYGSLTVKQYRWVAKFLEGNKAKTEVREMIEKTYREMIASGEIDSNF